MSPLIKRLVAVSVITTILTVLVGCHSEPQTMTQEDFEKNKKAGVNPNAAPRK